MAKQNSQVSAFEKRSPGRQMRPINALGDPEPHHRWSGWRIVNSPKFWCWHSSSIVFKLFIGCPNQNYYKIMYTHYLSSWIYKYNPFFLGGGGGGEEGVVPGDTICNITQFKFCLNLHICNDGSPRIGMGDPTTRLGWSVWRPRILIFQKHCPSHMKITEYNIYTPLPFQVIKCSLFPKICTELYWHPSAGIPAPYGLAKCTIRWPFCHEALLCSHIWKIRHRWWSK